MDTHRESGADFVDACSPITLALKECMEANSEYYAPLLEGAPAEETAEGEEAGAESAGQGEGSGVEKEAAAAATGRAETKESK